MRKTILSLVALCLVAFPLLASAATQSGVVSDLSGNLLEGFRVDYVHVGINEPISVFTNDQGRYTFNAPSLIVIIGPADPNYQNVEFSPNNYSVQGGTSHANLNFVAQTGTGLVTGSVLSDAGDPDPTGVYLYVGSTHVATTDDNGFYYFDPSNLGLQDSGYVTFKKSFHTFSSGSLYYDVSSENDELEDNYLSMADLADFADVEYSWDEGGVGVAFWVFTPDNRALNNPYLVAQADFLDSVMSTPIPNNRIKLRSTTGSWLPSGGIYAVNNVAYPWYMANFSWHLEENSCELLNLEVLVGLDRWDGGVTWQAINTPFPSGVSDMDLLDDDVIDLNDLVVFSGVISTEEGDPNFEPCADFFPDGVIDMSDVSVFVLLFNSAKAASDRQDALVEWGADGGDAPLVLSSPEGFTVAAIQCLRSGSSSALPEWVSDPAFSGLSLMVPLDEDSFILYLVSTVESTSAQPGRLVFAEGDGPDGWRIQSVETASRRDISTDPGSLEPESAPSVLRLSASPNPFNPQIVLRFTQPQAGSVFLRIYDTSGHLVQTLIDKHLPAGQQEVTWYGRDDSGRQAAAGVYFAQLVQGRDSVVEKLVLLK